jgi:hypothetical protein
MIHPALLVSLGLASHASAACTRAALEEATASYIRSQAAGKPNLLNLSTNTTYTENDTPKSITQGVLSQPLTIDFSRSIHDPVLCATFTELNAASSPHPYVILTRLALTPEATTDNLTITTIDSVITDAGDWLFNATSHLHWTTLETWPPIPPSSPTRTERTTLLAAADAYLNQWATPSIAVPLNTPCARLEGGAYTAEKNPTGNTCKMPAFPVPIVAGNRRYVVDEEMGAVGVLNGFPWLEKTAPAERAMASGNLFRVEKGLVRYVHEVTVCETVMCGR